MLDLQEALAVAVEAARTAGAIHLAHVGRPLDIRSKSSSSDLVTEVDGLAEAAIREVIARRYPDHAVLGEEEGLGQGAADGAADAPLRWVVDPLDGTVNYAHGFPVYCASVALEVRGEAVVGAVFDPSRQELFTAVRGGSALLNGERLTVSATPTLTTPALVSTGFPYDQSGGRNLAPVQALLRLGVPIRRPGAAALDLCNVACGRMDAYWETGLKPWDAAAGSLLVQEAGGRVTDAQGRPTPGGEVLIASNGHLHAELLTLLRGALGGGGGN
ncbi:inositol monophosphatase family protein [Deinococcus budaensis]|uniref:Inositol-1-monophosphatase n=1 Tax=Deinococcus budaensis TaxID=1665626 RepID=A0A7W8LNZ8_9DEIO|nr:inositol monophosphatase family protein [Deinococcus budaensis]MBB5233030.1 myo-inositol-1(or 4)-monophosphatase [Deinococcus budaensis]